MLLLEPAVVSPVELFRLTPTSLESVLILASARGYLGLGPPLRNRPHFDNAPGRGRRARKPRKPRHPRISMSQALLFLLPRGMCFTICIRCLPFGFFCLRSLLVCPAY